MKSAACTPLAYQFTALKGKSGVSLKHDGRNADDSRVVIHRFCPVDVAGLPGDCGSCLFPPEAWVLRINATLLPRRQTGIEGRVKRGSFGCARMDFFVLA